MQLSPQGLPFLQTLAALAGAAPAVVAAGVALAGASGAVATGAALEAGASGAVTAVPESL